MTDASQPPAVTPPATRPWTPVVPLTDGVVTLRAHSLDDADAIVEQSTDPASLRWTTVPRPYSRDDALGWVEHNLSAWGEPGGTRSWAIEWTDETGAPRYGGTIDLRPGAAPSAGELGFGLHPDARGPGTDVARGAARRRARLRDARLGRAGHPRPLARRRRQLGLAPGGVGGGLHLPRHDPGQPPRPGGRRRGARHVDRQHHPGRPALGTDPVARRAPGRG